MLSYMLHDHAYPAEYLGTWPKVVGDLRGSIVIMHKIGAMTNTSCLKKASQTGRKVKFLGV